MLFRSERRAEAEEEEETPLLEEPVAPVVPVVAREEEDSSYLFGALALALARWPLADATTQVGLRCWLS